MNYESKNAPLEKGITGYTGALDTVSRQKNDSKMLTRDQAVKADI